MVSVIANPYELYFSKDWSFDKESAIIKANEMRDKKIKSLKKT